MSDVKNGPSTNQVTANNLTALNNLVVFLFCFCSSVASKIFQTYVNLSSNDMLYIKYVKSMLDLNLFSVIRSQVVSLATLMVPPGLSMHFICDHFCLDFIGSYFVTLYITFAGAHIYD